MTDAALTPPATSLRQTVEARLKKRHAQEMRFRLYGRLAIVVAPEVGDYSVIIRTLGGKSVRRLAAAPSRSHVLAGLPRCGTFLVEVRGTRGSWTKKVRIP